ncbi:MAG: helix-turn-helix domain-containing protein [Gammaproteobacteria bacterium]
MTEQNPTARGIELNGSRIRELRKLRGWTQTRLAAVSGISERTIRSAEKGQSVDMFTWTTIAASLAVNKEHLLPNYSPPANPPSPGDCLVTLLRSERAAALLGLLVENDLIKGDQVMRNQPRQSPINWKPAQ